jgi:hypothetical protein
MRKIHQRELNFIGISPDIHHILSTGYFIDCMIIMLVFMQENDSLSSYALCNIAGVPLLGSYFSLGILLD